jgi:site-specific DNA recombinase
MMMAALTFTIGGFRTATSFRRGLAFFRRRQFHAGATGFGKPNGNRLFSRADRLSRSLLDFARIIGIFEKHHVSFVSITQQFNSATSMGRLVLNVLLSFAQFEREIISERTRDKIAATRRKGKWSGGLPVLGYDVDPQVLRLVANPKEAARVRAIFDLYLKHQALLPVVRELERRGWRTKVWVTRKGRKMGGQLFTKTNLHKLLTNATYAGKLRYKKELHHGEHPAIVDPAKWQKVQELLQRHRHRGSAERNRSGAILKGLLYCRPCGCAMSPTYSSKGSKSYRYYVCSNAQQRGWEHCPSQSVPAGPMERIVLEQIAKVGQDPDRLKKILLEASKQRRTRLADLESERRRLERELQILTESLPPKAGNGDNHPGLEAVQENIGHLERRLSENNQQVLLHQQPGFEAAQAAQALAALEQVIGSLPQVEQARFIRSAVQRARQSKPTIWLRRARVMRPSRANSAAHKLLYIMYRQLVPDMDGRSLCYFARS